MSFEVLRYEGSHRIRSALGISAAFVVMAVAFLAFAPQIVVGGGMQQLADALPPQIVAALGLRSLTSVEGLLAGEFYTLFWSVFFGIYLAYAAAGSIAGDITTGRMDTLLAAPVSRTRVLVEKFLSLLVPILVASVVVPAAIYLGARLVDQPVPLADLAAVHALSIPYLLCCGAIGLVLSVFLDRDTAQNTAIGVLFALYLLQSLVAASDFEWLGNLAPMTYFDANAILLDGTYDLVSAGILLAAAVVLVAVSHVRFTRMDIQ